MAISQVNMEVMMKWIVKRVTELLGMEDEVLCGFIEGLLQEKVSARTLAQAPADQRLIFLLHGLRCHWWLLQPC